MTKGPVLQQLWNELPEDEKREVRARSQEIIREYRILQQVREAVGLTQASVAERLNMAQPNVSRLEKNNDVKLSTLHDYVEALGGHVNVTIELPNHLPLSLELGDFLDTPSGEVQPTMQ